MTDHNSHRVPAAKESVAEILARAFCAAKQAERETWDDDAITEADHADSR